ncbi:MAG: glycosyltransferase [Clostridia bacterium]|nr:glycosyltransferase [Clostridia bacterium]
MDNIEVSIIMGIYNCAKYLDESINSILNQTYKKWELIMCDDGSIDETYRIAKSYEEKYKNKIIVLKNEKNMGLNYTLNKCLELARGKYIARQDGDDISESDRIEKEVNFLNNNFQYALVSTNMSYFDDNGIWGHSNSKEIPSKNDFIKGSPFCHAPCMIRKKVLSEVGRYTVDSKLLRVEDYHLWFKIYAKGYVGYNIQEPLYKMRDDNDAYIRRNWKNRINEARVRFIGYKMLKLPIYSYIYCLRPIVLFFLPSKLYLVLHKKNKKEESKDEKI